MFRRALLISSIDKRNDYINWKTIWIYTWAYVKCFRTALKEIVSLSLNTHTWGWYHSSHLSLGKKVNKYVLSKCGTINLKIHKFGLLQSSLLVILKKWWNLWSFIIILVQNSFCKYLLKIVKRGCATLAEQMVDLKGLKWNCRWRTQPGTWIHTKPFLISLKMDHLTVTFFLTFKILTNIQKILL